MAATKCMCEGCGADAVWQVGFKIWPVGHPRRRDNCLSALASICLCDAHKGAARLADFLTPGGRELIANQLLRMGRAMPDFASAELEFRPIVDAPVDVTKPWGS